MMDKWRSSLENYNFSKTSYSDVILKSEILYIKLYNKLQG